MDNPPQPQAKRKVGWKIKTAIIAGSFIVFVAVLGKVLPSVENANTVAKNKNTEVTANTNSIPTNTNTTKELLLTVTQPQWNAVTTASQVIVKGNVTSHDAVVSVNGKSATLTADGAYSIALDLPTDEAVDKDPKKSGFFIEVIARAGGQEKKQSGYISKIPSDAYRLQVQEAEFAKTPAGKICASNPTWTHDDCQQLADNKVWIGMSYDMLVYKRGKPDSINPSNYGYGTQYQYCWNHFKPSCFYDKNGDKLMDSFN